MLLPALLLFFACLILSAFFSASETAFIGANIYSLEYLENKGSRRARMVRKTLGRVDDLLATILIGNTLVNAAAASLATYVFVTLMPGHKQIVLYATLATTVFLLFFSEINPKIYAAYHPLKLSFLFVWPIRFFMALFYPFVKGFTLLSSLVFNRKGEQTLSRTGALSEGETKVLLTSGIKGMSAFRKKMIVEILDLAARPIREIMTPRPQIRALEIGATQNQILETVLLEEFSRYPVYRGRLDHIEGFIHTKDILPVLIRREPIELGRFLRPPFFVPESAPVEKVLIQMQEKAVHMAFVVDEFGNMEGLITLEDLIEEIVGDILDEYDDKEEDWFAPAGEGALLVKGAAAIKDVNDRLALQIPESPDYTTLAGFFLYEFGRLPREKDALDFRGRRFSVEKMSKRHIHQIRVEPASVPARKAP